MLKEHPPLFFAEQSVFGSVDSDDDLPSPLPVGTRGAPVRGRGRGGQSKPSRTKRTISSSSDSDAEIISFDVQPRQQPDRGSKSKWKQNPKADIPGTEAKRKNNIFVANKLDDRTFF